MIKQIFISVVAGLIVIAILKSSKQTDSGGVDDSTGL